MEEGGVLVKENTRLICNVLLFYKENVPSSSLFPLLTVILERTRENVHTPTCIWDKFSQNLLVGPPMAREITHPFLIGVSRVGELGYRSSCLCLFHLQCIFPISLVWCGLWQFYCLDHLPANTSLIMKEQRELKRYFWRHILFPVASHILAWRMSLGNSGKLVWHRLDPHFHSLLRGH